MNRHLIIFLSLLSISSTVFAEQSSYLFTPSGDVRMGFFDKHRDDRAGKESSVSEWRLRLRAGVKAQLSSSFSAKLRFAGRYSTEQDGTKFYIDGSIPSTDGLKAGESTIDEVYVNYAIKPWNLRLGRMQTKFELKGVAKKSLDRSDSPNTDVNWTDGAMLTFNPANQWKTHVILQRNLSGGASNVRRAPLDFSDSGSRLSYMAVVENDASVGSIVQRGVHVSYLPDSLMKDGNTFGAIEDYWAITAKAAAQWPMASHKTKFMLASQIGYAPETQTNLAAGLGQTGDTSGTAVQVSANIINFYPDHSFGLVYGHIGAGWLISGDFRNNNNLIEGRYRWNVMKNLRLEGRLRKREELEQKTSTIKRQEDVDLYVRLTYKFKR